mmetsp:Transcript_110161/g.318417  ORF Transcript_110161/g.318417 Transcript_110161/m.318417 type:complete len:617 (-) Transcript_110161:142-1992(-)|eukprot:CAMPEP_0176131314 /NCGR_PEP_ID=MMETSP0120_2-20121206/66476_1 /TAXON_ID=160619 /ORGANISM="Kryptoperidinium foliaceum, Strain CCMP 1326" /LENGTH=616 /DNA_ID=CAMNT_0017466685 /DNA_START=431 /DNA_END=2281 /DNA_ORIENTATION=+
MNGQQGNDQGGQGVPDSHLSYLLNAAGGQAALLGYPGGLGGGQRLGFGGGDASLEEQILQRASALRAEALLQQQRQQQAHQGQHNLGAALAALQQQQQQLSSLGGLNPNHLAALSAQEQEALLGRAAALRELGIGGTGGAGGAGGGSFGGVGMDRLQQLELGRLEEIERRRQQLAALAGFSGAPTAPPRPAETPSNSDKMQDSGKGDSVAEKQQSAQPATAAPKKTKEELRKTPGTVIVPCRARGMPMDHNFKTAYFVISEDAKHGEDLVCSYFACRNGGVKFRYCAHCMAPVAKRNFCRRHDHGMSEKLPPREDDDDESVEDGKGFEEAELAQKVNNNMAALAAALDAPAKISKATPKSKDSEDKTQSKRKAPVAEEDDDDEAELAHISKKRRKMWSALLVKRPRTKDPRHLSSWLNEVLTVSDFDTTLEQAESESPPKPSKRATPKKSKAEKDPEVKEKKANGEKKKRKSSESRAESKAKKEKLENEATAKKKANADMNGSPKEKASNSGIDVPKKGNGSSKAGESKEANSEQAVEKQKDSIPSDNASNSDASEKDGKSNEEVESSTKPEPKAAEAKSPVKPKEDDEGFAGSFADWRDRKKDKLLKKGNGSLKN